MMGLGNSYYALGDLKNSEIAFRRAAEAHPENGAAFNNLAHVLLALARREEALEAARRAVALGGPHQSVFQKTLQEIQAAAP
jgi:tetratricopeptide (TPR) repeat protein